MKQNGLHYAKVSIPWRFLCLVFFLACPFQRWFLDMKSLIMKKLILPFLLSSLMVGCSSTVSTPNLEQFSEYSGGSVMGDTTSLFWYTEYLSSPFTAADYITAGEYGWYKTDYRWDEGELRELIREGEQLSLQQSNEQELVPYRIHARFNKNGEAIYQQYRMDGKVFPLRASMIEQLQQEARNIGVQTKQQAKQGIELVQGYWDGSQFESCEGRSYTEIEFNQTLPSFVVSRLASIDSYVAFLGSTRGNRVVVEELLMLAEDSHDCMQRTVLVE